MSANAQNNIPTNAEQTTVVADAQETERIATVETPQQSSIFPPHANPDMQQGGETGRSRGRRMPMQQQGPQDQQDENSSDSNSKSGESDSGESSTESSDWLMEFFEIA